MINGQHWGDVAFWLRLGATVALVALTTPGPAAAQMFFPPYGYPVPSPRMGRPAPPHHGVKAEIVPLHPEARAEVIDPEDDDDDTRVDIDDEDRPRRQRTAAGQSRGKAAAHFRRQHAHRSASNPAPSRLMVATPPHPRIATKVPSPSYSRSRRGLLSFATV